MVLNQSLRVYEKKTGEKTPAIIRRAFKSFFMNFLRNVYFLLTVVVVLVLAR